jgi:hypothetical protein
MWFHVENGWMPVAPCIMQLYEESKGAELLMVLLIVKILSSVWESFGKGVGPQ